MTAPTRPPALAVCGHRDPADLAPGGPLTACRDAAACRRRFLALGPREAQHAIDAWLAAEAATPAADAEGLAPLLLAD